MRKEKQIIPASLLLLEATTNRMALTVDGTCDCPMTSFPQTMHTKESEQLTINLDTASVLSFDLWSVVSQHSGNGSSEPDRDRMISIVDTKTLLEALKCYCTYHLSDWSERMVLARSKITILI